VVLASGGYPGEFEKGYVITGLSDDCEGTFVCHSGTDKNGNGEILTNGGRVLSVAGTGADFAEARERAYKRVSQISFEGMRYRRDIGWSEE
jgi:phosphoribosylamine--glycine ligase